MAESNFRSNYRKFANQSKKNQLKILNNLKDIDFTKLELFCFKTETKIKLNKN